MQVIKKIDRLLLISFVPPFILAFCIAIFVLVMQFLWSFIDDIVGKGVDTFVLIEMIFYRSLALFPMALPIGVLLASVMVFGNLSERYELSSMKSAGISLIRIMAPAIAFSVAVAVFSFYCSNTLIPLSNLKFQSRLYDIRNQKPMLSLEEGIFNDDFMGYTIRIGNKESDNRTIHDVLIYDESGTSRRNFHLITARKGEMYVDNSQNAFVFKLYDGVQYQEPEDRNRDSGFPFIRTHFESWEKHFDLSEFEMEQTPEKYFKSHHTMKSVLQLTSEIDSISQQYVSIKEGGTYAFTNLVRESAEKPPPPGGEVADSLRKAAIEEKRISNRPQAAIPEVIQLVDSLNKSETVDHFYSLLTLRDLRGSLTRAIPNTRRAQDQAIRSGKALAVLEKSLSNHIFELHLKFSFAVICIVFLFLGAPMGAIVRKGGFGYPLLIAIAFFMVFIVLHLTFKKLAETQSVDAVFAAWAPTIALVPVSIYLSYKALNDSKMLDVDKYLRPLLKLFQKNLSTRIKYDRRF